MGGAGVVTTTRAWRCEVCRSFSENSLEAINNCTMGGDRWPDGCGFTEVYVVPVSEAYDMDEDGDRLVIPAPEEAS